MQLLPGRHQWARGRRAPITLPACDYELVSLNIQLDKRALNHFAPPARFALDALSAPEFSVKGHALSVLGMPKQAIS